MKKRYSNGYGNKNILDKEFKYIWLEENDFKGYVSYLKLKKVEKDWFVPRDGRKPDCIQAENYIWLSIYPTDENYGITAMLNNKKEVVEWYIDITNSTSIENDVPYIEDLYLDIVITNRDEIIILDEDELEEAHQKHDITNEQYNLVLKVKEMLINKYSKKSEIECLRKFTLECLEKFD